MSELVNNLLLLFNSGLVITAVIAAFKWVKQITLDIEEVKHDIGSHDKDFQEHAKRLDRLEERIFRRGFKITQEE